MEAPIIEVEVDPIPPISLEQTMLTDEKADGIAKAIEIQRIPVPIAVAVIVCTNVAWVQNLDVAEYGGDPRRMDGLALAHGILRGAAWASATEAGGTLQVIRYDRTATVVVPPVGLTQLPDEPLGPKEQYSDGNRFLGDAVKLALDQVLASSAPRRLLIVIGDGIDNSSERIDMLSLRARDNSIEILALDYPNQFDPEGKSRTSELSTGNRRKIDGIAAGVAAVNEQLAKRIDRYRVRFDASAFAWDGEMHQLRFDGDDVSLPPFWAMLPAERAPAWVRWGLAGLALLALALVMLTVRRAA